MHRVLFLIALIVSVINGTPLDDYVNRPDPTSGWKIIRTHEAITHTRYVLNFTSQSWFNSSFSSHPIWWHHMVIHVPRIRSQRKTALIYLSDGSNTDPPPTEENWLSAVAVVTGTVAVELKQIPNQPITFVMDPTHQSRSEDGIIAYTWDTFIRSNGIDPDILLYLPMTKAAVRAMDATEDFLRKKRDPVPENFVVVGGSKRGWTTWLTAAVDNKRVIGAIPIVMDLLNLQKNMKHHYQSLNGWTFALGGYYAENITRLLDNPYFQTMADIIDPYAYFDRYKNMKLCQFQGADDEFFLPDSEDYFWNDLQIATGGSYLDRVANSGHGIAGYAVESVLSFYLSVCDNATLPSWTWTRTINATHGQIVANVSTDNGHPSPINVTVYQARTVNGTLRDFRLHKLDPTTKQMVTNPIVWLQMNDNIEIIRMNQSIIYSYVAPMPPAGYWDGIFMQMTFPGPQNTSLNLTTETLTIPNTFPVGPCLGEQCYGTLV